MDQLGKNLSTVFEKRNSSLLLSNYLKKLIKNNKQFAEKISDIKKEEAEDKMHSKSQEDIYTEESIYTKFTSTEDNNLMPEFHRVDWDQKRVVLSKFKDERLKYFGNKLHLIKQ